MSHSSQQRRFSRIDLESDVVATPEGDNEYAPGQPIGPVQGLQAPSGSAPAPYNTDVAREASGGSATGAADGHAEDEVKKTVDKLSLGQILT